MHLIGTAEVPLASLHQDEILSVTELPKKYAGWSTCFRREAGAYGKDTKGIYRVHQFQKVELFQYIKPADSENEFDKLIDTAEKFIQSFYLPYRKLKMSAPEISLSGANKYDLEIWLPGMKKWGEVCSGTNTTDFQTQRLNIKYQDQSGKKYLLHTQNCTAMASPRFLIALVENYQLANGSIEIPKVLQPYLGGKKLISF